MGLLPVRCLRLARRRRAVHAGAVAVQRSQAAVELRHGRQSAVNPYQSLSQLSVGWVASGATEIPAMTLSSLMPNPDLHWEQKTEFNAGLDGAVFDNRVAFSLDVYRSKTRDLLLLM